MNGGANMENAVVVSAREGVPITSEKVEDAETSGAVGGDLGEVEMVACGLRGCVRGAEEESTAGLKRITGSGCPVA